MLYWLFVSYIFHCFGITDFTTFFLFDTNVSCLENSQLNTCILSFRPSSLKGRHGDYKKRPVAPIKLSEPENSQFQYQNFQSRSRLDARLWLACRIALVKALTMEIRGMGDVKGQLLVLFMNCCKHHFLMCFFGEIGNFNREMSTVGK